MQTELPVYQAKITGIDNTGIFAMSFVDFPANESNFVALAATAHRAVKLSLDKQKQILTGAVLVPDQLIYRNDSQLGEYYLTFSEQDIEKIRDKMMKTGLALRTTTHQHEKPLRDNVLVECWIVEDPKRDKATALGLGELPKGTLVASYKVGNATYWRSQVLAGKVKGFSIEGLFNFKSVKMATTPKKKVVTPATKTDEGVFMRVMRALLADDSAGEAKALATVAGDDATDSAEVAMIFTLQDGSEIFVDADGYATTADGAQAPAGDHTLDDGNTISIDDAGMFIETTNDPAAAEPAAAPAALSKAQRAAAVAAGKAKVAELAKPKAPTANSKEIAKLKAQIAKLEAEPSAAPAKPTAVDPAVAERNTNLKGHERAAAMIRARAERNKK